jgi:predicted nucleic acid-binding protein
MIVVSDISPLNYPILIDCQDVLPALFGQIIIPQAVFATLESAGKNQGLGYYKTRLARSPKRAYKSEP